MCKIKYVQTVHQKLHLEKMLFLVDGLDVFFGRRLIVREVKREPVVSARAIKEKLSMNVSEYNLDFILHGFKGLVLQKKPSFEEKIK